jgi:hypothetical protein
MIRGILVSEGIRLADQPIRTFLLDSAGLPQKNLKPEDKVLLTNIYIEKQALFTRDTAS